MAAAGAPGVGADVAVGQPILQDRILQASTVCAADDRDFISEILAGSLPLGVSYESDPELALSLQAAANLGEAAAAAAAAAARRRRRRSHRRRRRRAHCSSPPASLCVSLLRRYLRHKSAGANIAGHHVRRRLRRATR